jgi:hypothetical protein
MIAPIKKRIKKIYPSDIKLLKFTFPEKVNSNALNKKYYVKIKYLD